HTEFIYTTKDEVKLQCSTNKWQISTESDNIIDVSCTVECVNGETLKLNNTQNSCTNKNSYKVGEKCLLIARSGFFLCVSALDSGFLFPFKPSPNTVTSYIVATANEEMTNKSEERSSVKLTEGEDVHLNCSFNLTGENDNQNFILYWIKTIGKSSSCVYSYDYDTLGITYNHHCTVQEQLRYRLTNQTEDKNTHNIRISNVTESDAGQYLCALQIQGKWKIIKTITVSDSKTSDNSGFKAPLYATILILLVLALAAVGFFIWKKTKTSSGSQAMELQRNQNGDKTEEAVDME
ncbi:paired immunoglobulin-like type 2 receptor alpha, partial [Clarias magur]